MKNFLGGRKASAEKQKPHERFLKRQPQEKKEFEIADELQTDVEELGLAESEYELDVKFYRTFYFDLASMDDVSLEMHWKDFGKSEGRYSSLKEFCKRNSFDFKLFSDFSSKFYIDYYPDVSKLCLSDAELAYKHYAEYGISEQRTPSSNAYIKSNNLSDFIIRSGLQLEDVVEHNNKKGLFVDYDNLIQMLKMEQPSKINLSDDEKADAEFYVKLGKHYEMSGDEEKARNAYLISCMFCKRGDALELIGNYYYRRKNYLTSIHYYEAGLRYGSKGRWIYENLANSYFEKDMYQKAFETLISGKSEFQEVVLFDELLDEKIKFFWQRRQVVHDAYSLMQDRESLLRIIGDDIQTIHEAYKSMYRSYGEPFPKVVNNKKRVLIVGDFFLTQCVRYRINQKLEQLELAGYECDTVDWINVNSEFSKFSFYDFIIFYRTPAVPEIVKAMTYCNHLGKVTVYEIDDMVFDIEYPIDIQSYGGYVSLGQYKDLTKGMALFNNAIKYADFGIASTTVIQKRLEKYVAKGKCYIHRNGLDSKNYGIGNEIKRDKKFIDIFYGSGTKAHNSDFIEEILPAMDEILSEYPSVRLVIAGYLNLPDAIIEKYKERIKFLPFVNSVEAYWGYLRQADINLAVLSPDIINDGKSELKWFEAGYFGIPSVVSSTQNYKDVVKHGIDGLIASSHTEWFQSLKLLIESKDVRLKMGQAAKERANTDYSLESLSQNLDEIINDALVRIDE